jgi:hypothetical protein
MMVRANSDWSNALHHRIDLLKHEQEALIERADLSAAERLTRYLVLSDMLQELNTRLTTPLR